MGSGLVSEVHRLQMLLAERHLREESIRGQEAALAIRKARLQKKTLQMHTWEEDLELRERKLHRAEQTTQLLVRQNKDATEFLDRLSGISK
jgi:hypothetical protein